MQIFTKKYNKDLINNVKYASRKGTPRRDAKRWDAPRRGTKKRYHEKRCHESFCKTRAAHKVRRRQSCQEEMFESK